MSGNDLIWVAAFLAAGFALGCYFLGAGISEAASHIASAMRED